MAFEVEKQFDLDAQDAPGTHGLIRSLTDKSILRFKGSAEAAHYGVYVFAMRAHGGAGVRALVRWARETANVRCRGNDKGQATTTFRINVWPYRATCTHTHKLVNNRFRGAY